MWNRGWDRKVNDLRPPERFSANRTVLQLRGALMASHVPAGYEDAVLRIHVADVALSLYRELLYLLGEGLICPPQLSGLGGGPWGREGGIWRAHGGKD